MPGEPPVPCPEASDARIRSVAARAVAAVTTHAAGLPRVTAVHAAESDHATLGHAAVRGSRQPSRLDRTFGRKHCGDAGHARAARVADRGAVVLVRRGQSVPGAVRDSASWISVLSGDTRAIISAAVPAARSRNSTACNLARPQGRSETAGPIPRTDRRSTPIQPRPRRCRPRRPLLIRSSSPRRLILKRADPMSACGETPSPPRPTRPR
ncbi:zincin-like metallopeptidase domain-containing protein [Methylobacterium nodulans]|uniref:zincin-like metallopeptidase domain-containing protein n=1 Tax=Methylobacterium nodulans TaxID=114616 RepID=UPI003CC73DAC